jgi:ATP-binding cassette subfamily C protein
MIRQYLSGLIRYSSTQFFTTLMLMVGYAFVSGIGVISLLPMLYYSGFLTRESYQGNLSAFLEFLPSFNTHISLFVTLAVFVLIVGAVAFLDYFKTYYSSRFRFGFEMDLHNRLNRSLADADWAYLLTQKMTQTQHMIISGIPKIGLLTHSLFSLISDGIFSIAFLGLSFVISPLLTLLVCGICIVLLAVMPLRPFLSKGHAQFEIHQEIQAEVSHFLDGIKLAKSYNRTSDYVRRFDDLNGRYFDYALSFLNLQSRARVFFSIFAALIFSVLFLVGFTVIHIPMVNLLIFLLIFSRLAPRFQSLYQMFSRVINYLPAYKLAIDMISDFDQHREIAQLSQSLALEHFIEFRQVSFSYAGHAALHDVQCHIESNTTTAIVGMSGAGKSTMADLLLGLISPTQGKILVDGNPLDASTVVSFRDSVGYVPQDVHLFHDTVRNNLIWAAPEASDDELWDALRQAALDQVIRELPLQLDSQIGDKGIRLSGGERQRLALARALLRKPRILILDEATSALDHHHEEMIYRTLHELHGRLTLIVIAHRFATIRDADNVILLAQGKLIESGPASQLMADPQSAFCGLFSKQGQLG